MTTDSRSWFTYTFLRHTPQRHALMLPPSQSQKYYEHPTSITPHQLDGHLAGKITLAVPAAANRLSCVLPLDVDRGGRAAIQALLATATQAGWWAFGQYCPRPDWIEADQRGYVWLVFDTLVDHERLQQLGRRLITQAALPPKTVEARAHHAVTRLPLGKHTHSNAFGILMLPNGREVCIDDDPGAALATLQTAYQPNRVALVPEVAVAPPADPTPPLPSRPRAGANDTASNTDVIRHYNQQTDIRGLVEQYAGKRASYTVYHCPCGQHNNDDRVASLGIVRARTDRYGAWMVKGYAEWCAFHTATDAFGVYCHCEGITAKEAVKRLAEELGLNQRQPRARPTQPPPPSEDDRRQPHHPPMTPPPSPNRVPAAIRQGVLLRLAQDTTLTRATRRVMSFLIDQTTAYQSHWCRPSIARMAAACGVVERTVQIATRRLATAGYLTIDHSGNAGHGGDETNIYTLCHALSAQGGRSGRSPEVNRDHDHDSESDLKLGRGGNPDPHPTADVPLPDRETVHPESHVDDQPPPAEPPPARLRVWPHRESLAWLDALGRDVATLEAAAVTAKREARRLFAQKKASDGKKRMWQANQITDRIAHLAQRPADALETHPASARCQDVLAQVARLQELGIYPDNARRYAHLPAATLDQAETLARTIDGDLPSLVVAFLKRHTEDGWPIPAPPAPADAPFDLATYTGDDSPYRDFFRTPARDTQADEPPTGAAFQPLAIDADEPPSAAPPPREPDHPAWITSVRWHSLAPPLRDLLRGARLQGRTVTAADPACQAQLARYTAELGILIAVAGIAAAPPRRARDAPGATS